VKFSIFPTSFQTRHSPKFIPPLAFRLWLFPASPARHGRLEKSRSIRPDSTPRGSSAQMSDYHTSPDNARPTEIISFEFSFRPESGKGRPPTVDMPPIEGDDFGRGHVRFPGRAYFHRTVSGLPRDQSAPRCPANRVPPQLLKKREMTKHCRRYPRERRGRHWRRRRNCPHSAGVSFLPWGGWLGSC
jgi:hypothetical protein